MGRDAVKDLGRGRFYYTLGILLNVGGLAWGVAIFVVLVTDPGALLTASRMLAILGMSVGLSLVAFGLVVSGILVFMRGTRVSIEELQTRIQRLEGMPTAPEPPVSDPTRPA